MMKGILTPDYAYLFGSHGSISGTPVINGSTSMPAEVRVLSPDYLSKGQTCETSRLSPLLREQQFFALLGASEFSQANPETMRDTMYPVGLPDQTMSFWINHASMSGCPVSVGQHSTQVRAGG
jgi:hypothetical protein